MRHFKIILILTLMIFYLQTVPICSQTKKPLMGYVHLHTTFSDGSDNIPQRVRQAKAEGCSFSIFSDHYEQIPLKNKGGDYAGTDFGFADYLRNCQEQTSADFICIPGAEIASFWNPEPNKTACSHTLILGFGDYDFGPQQRQLVELQMKNGTQQAIINRIKEIGYLSVAAHPTLITDMSLRWHFWRGSDFRYDLRPANEQPNGLEMFNVENRNQQEDLVRRYLHLVNQKIPIFVTSGCDSHKWFPWRPEQDHQLWGRQTGVYADALTQQAILEGLKHGHSYAANYRAHGYLSPLPGFTAQRVDKAEFRCSVVFEKPTDSSKTIRIYRDGQLVEKSVQDYPAGFRQIDYSFVDEDVTEGEHWYVLEVPMTLITSPIVLNIQRTPPVSPEASVIMLVMDASGSMQGEKMLTAQRAAQAFIDFCKTDDWVGIDEFSTVGKFIQAPTKVESISKEVLKRLLYQNPQQQSTNMGAGLDIAIRELDKINVEPDKKSIVLMSDGMHNTGELWSFVNDCKRRGYKVYTVAFGGDADLKTLEKIAADTGGECSYGSIRNLVQIYNFISSQIKRESTFYASSSWLRQDQKISYKVAINHQSSSFFVDWQGSKIETVLIDPSGQQVKPEQMEKCVLGENYQYNRIKNPAQGDWQVQLFGKDIPSQGEQINFTVSGEDEVYLSFLPLKTSYHSGEKITVIVKACAINQQTKSLEPLERLELKGSICQPGIRPAEFIRHKKIYLDKLLFRAIDQNKSLRFEDLGSHKYKAVFRSKMQGLHQITINAKLGFKVGEQRKLIERQLKASVMVGRIEDFTVDDFLKMIR